MSTVAAAGLQAGLAELSAPAALRRWAQPFAQVEPAWEACPAPEWLIWIAARLAGTAGQRAAVTDCAVRLVQQAADPARPADPRVLAAITAARDWATAEPAKLQAAASAAFEVAARTAAQATGDAAHARLLSKGAPRRRLASAAASRALAAWEDWRAADYAARLARAAAWTALAAADARAGERSPLRWADCISQAAAHSLAALEARDTVRGRARPPAARRLSALIRRDLPCPRM